MAGRKKKVKAAGEAGNRAFSYAKGIKAGGTQEQLLRHCNGGRIKGKSTRADAHQHLYI
jgi:hypothetical protein